MRFRLRHIECGNADDKSNDDNFLREALQTEARSPLTTGILLNTAVLLNEKHNQNARSFVKKTKYILGHIFC